MKNKNIVITENQLANIIASKLMNDFIGKPSSDKEDFATSLFNKFFDKSSSGSTSTLKPTDNNTGNTGTKSDSTQKNIKVSFGVLDLNNPEDYKAYADIAQKYINTRSHNLLNITGEMLASGAKKAQNQTGTYVPPEISLAQLALEGGFVNNPNARPIRTKNPYNVGNVDSGANVQHGNVQSGIDTYYSLMARNYLGNGRTVDDLLTNFVNKNDKRYASAKGYESNLKSIVDKVKTISEPIYASIEQKRKSNLA